jgi:hypothetical protein
MLFSLPRIPDDILREATKLHQTLSANGAFNNSLTEGEGLLQGTVGEVLVKRFLQSAGVPVEHIGKPDFDLLADGARIEVKTRRQTGPAIMPHYEVNVMDRLSMGLPQQDCDVYVFCCVDYDVQYGGIIGWDLHWSVYHSQRWATRKKGEKLGSGNGASNDCWVRQFGALSPPSALPDYISHWMKKNSQPR